MSTTWRRAAAVVAALVFTWGCTSTEERGRAADAPREVAELSGLRSGQWSVWAATESTLVGLNRYHGHPSAEDPVIGHATDTRTGRRTELVAPEDPELPHFAVQVARGTGDRIVMAGVRCEDYELDEQTDCPRPDSYEWSLAGGWRALDLPSGTDDVSDIALGDDGEVYAVLRRAARDEPNVLAVLEGTSWRAVGSLPSKEHLEVCVADGVGYSLGRHVDLTHMVTGEPGDTPGDSVPDGQPPATITLTAMSVSDGRSSEVATPPLMGDFGGRLVQLGCGPGGPVLATQRPDRTVAVHEWSGDGWSDLALPPAAGSQMALIDVIEWSGGTAFEVETTDPAPREQWTRTLLVVTADGLVARDVVLAGGELVVIGSKGTVARVPDDPADVVELLDLTD